MHNEGASIQEIKSQVYMYRASAAHHRVESLGGQAATQVAIGVHRVLGGLLVLRLYHLHGGWLLQVGPRRRPLPVAIERSLVA